MIHRKIFFEENLPLNLEFIKMKNSYEYWQKEIQLVLVISGSVIVNIHGVTKHYSKRDVFIINSNELYSIISETEETELLILHIDVIFMEKYIRDFSNIIFNIDKLNEDKEKYRFFNSMISQTFALFKNQEDDYKAKILKVTLELVDFLRKNYTIVLDENFEKNLEENRKIIQISDYIDKNYQDYLSLKMLGEKFNMNPQYISRFFKQNVGLGFQNYLNSLRIKKSLNDLLYSNKNIIDIALDNGFSEGKNYSRAFKREYGITPVEFRKFGGKHKKEKGVLIKESLILNEKLEFLLKSLDYGRYEGELIPENIFEDVVEKDVSQSVSYEKIWKKMMAFGRAYEGLLGETQEQMKVIQKEIGFEYVRFTGIFNDEMMVYSEDEKGNPIYNWNYVDKLIDFLKSINLKPFINIGYMPEQMAKNTYHIFRWKGNVSYPTSIDKWNNLVKEFVIHLIERYGREEIETWHFEIWNNPDMSKLFWYESREKYFEFFKNSLNTIKSVSKKISVGGPSGGSIHSKKYFKLWMYDLYKYLENNHNKLDFFSTHLYIFREKERLKIVSQNNFSDSLNILNEELHKNFGKNVKLFISEWNPGEFYGNYTHDTCYMATNIIYNMINIFDKSSGIAFWVFSDIFEEYGIGKNIFHGGFGLFTLNGLKKASYNAFILLNKLGNEIIGRGEGWIVTKNENNIQVLMCNNAKFNSNFLDGVERTVDYYNRYDVFEKDKVKNIKINLSNLESGKYLLKRTRLNKSSGSVFDAWIKMGAPENINSDMLKILKAKENMDIYIKKEEIENEFEINEVLGSHCVTLFELEKQW